MKFQTISRRYSQAMQGLYWICIAIPAAALVIMTILVSASVFSRYALSYGASFFEPITVILAIQLTFFGAAACYRSNDHIRLSLFVGLLPENSQKKVIYFGTILMAIFSCIMVFNGISLAKTTFGQGYFEFPIIPAGAIYAGIPISGAIIFLFVIEKLFFQLLTPVEFATVGQETDGLEDSTK
ncbi:2,3-diketo-L-gulonate TRAP transporter small permease protein YiaM [Roseibium album]|nr:2,3-diketo-L-gulonate TRAP transporter small permease protein YiaM [Roseibium album]